MQLVLFARVIAHGSTSTSTVVEEELATEITRAHLRLAEQVHARYRLNVLENAFGHLSSLSEANLALFRPQRSRVCRLSMCSSADE